MRTRIQKWGNSLAVRIPRSFAGEARLEQDSLVELTLAEGGLLVRPVAEPEKMSLQQLVAGITEENRHGEVDFGPPIGNERW
jgi:antitoxin MazE